MPSKYIDGPEEKPQDVINRVVRYLANQYPSKSPSEALKTLGKNYRDAWLKSLSEAELQALEYDFAFWARPNQREPKCKYKIWLLLAGRGYGKSYWMGCYGRSSRWRHNFR
jgi:hypothetical protein